MHLHPHNRGEWQQKLVYGRQKPVQPSRKLDLRTAPLKVPFIVMLVPRKALPHPFEFIPNMIGTVVRILVPWLLVFEVDHLEFLVCIVIEQDRRDCSHFNLLIIILLDEKGHHPPILFRILLYCWMTKEWIAVMLICFL